ncbi:MAG: efflux RND transporter periplasmic adaptor subunit [Sphingomonadales bacterium]|nr:efflux RND transporter periplasmic adaptor subunit [Sphingomonadales bacterium]MDE2570727.1 efflux RND transporter periplasmic adaptor subunit [Sphingomonadales bacterium]
MSAPDLDQTSFDPIRLSPQHQVRMLAIAAAVVLGLWLAVMAIEAIFHNTPAPAPADPPGTFRPTAEQLRSLTLKRVGSDQLDYLTSATGTIAADGDLSTPVLLPYSGQVTRVLVDAGAVVRQGQPLLTIRTGDFVDARNTLFAADATLRSSQAQLLNARRNAERARALADTAGGARKDAQQAQTDLAAAEAQERSAEAAVGAARDKLAILGKSPAEITRIEGSREVSGLHEETTLHAPISGTVATRDVSPGQYVAVGGDKPVFTITNPSRVWLVAQLSETDASAVHVGDSADVTTPAYPGRVFHATIDLVGAGLDPATHRLPVRATIANPDLALKPQMFASFSIRRPSAEARVYVPATAVIHEGETARVWVLRPDRRLQARAVTTGEEQDGRIEVVSGLRPGETIVTSGAIFVNEAGLGS